MSRSRVVVAVSPRLLSESVRRVIDLTAVDTVEVHHEGMVEEGDLAIVSAGREAEVRAERIIVLVDPDGSVDDSDRAERVVVRSLVELQEAVLREVGRLGP